MLVPFGLGQYAVFALALGMDTNPMLRQTAEHVFAFADIDGLTVNRDFVDAWMFKLFSQASVFQHRINAILIGDFYGTMFHGTPPYI